MPLSITSWIFDIPNWLLDILQVTFDDEVSSSLTWASCWLPLVFILIYAWLNCKINKSETIVHIVAWFTIIFKWIALKFSPFFFSFILKTPDIFFTSFDDAISFYIWVEPCEISKKSWKLLFSFFFLLFETALKLVAKCKKNVIEVITTCVKNFYLFTDFLLLVWFFAWGFLSSAISCLKFKTCLTKYF